MEIGNQIKKFRGKLNWSQETLAEKAFVSRQTISNWENDKSYPDIHSLLLLGKLFNISLDELVKGDVESMKNEIEKNNTKKFNAMAWLLTAEYIIVTVSIIPLIKYLGWVGGLIWGILLSLSMFSAIKVEKLKKDNNFQTYKEIKDFMEGKSLDKISEERIKNLNKPIVKVICGMFCASIIVGICAFVFFR